MSETFYDMRRYRLGDVIFREGDPGAEMFIVQDGKVAVTKQVAGHEVFLATIERGDFFGEMAVLNDQPRHATCYALAPTYLLAIKSGELLMKLRRDPTFALEMLQTMSRRIRYLEQNVAKMMEDQMLSQPEFTKAVAKAEYRREPPR
jgi:CRP-like cAMP-binding protein